MRVALLALGLALAGCSLLYDFDRPLPEGLGAGDADAPDQAPRPDGAIDGAPADGTPTDAAPADAAPPDAAPPDAAPPDAAPGDGALPDAATDATVDATTDAAPGPDAGLDAEPPADAVVDAAPDVAPPPPDAAPDAASDAGSCHPDEGQPCFAGVGRCRREGVGLCVNGDLVCDAVPGDPGRETCNGIDDDCDGAVDDVELNPALVRRITQAENLSAYPSLAWTPLAGGRFLVAWVDNRTGMELVMAQVLLVDGSPLLDDPVVLSDDSVHAGPPAVTANGTGFAVTWTESGNQRDGVYLAGLDPDGLPTFGARRISEGAVSPNGPSITWFNGIHLVVWHDRRQVHLEIYAARIDAFGEKQGIDVRVSDFVSSSTYPSVAAAALGYGVAWEDNRHGPSQIYFQLLSPNGAPAGEPLRVTTSEGIATSPSLAWNADEFGLVWRELGRENNEIWFLRIGAGGQPLGQPVQVTDHPSSSLEPSIAASPGGWGVAWTDDRVGDHFDVHFVTLTRDGTPTGLAQQVGNGGVSAYDPWLVRAGDRFGLAFWDLRDDPEGDIYFTTGGCP